MLSKRKGFEVLFMADLLFFVVQQDLACCHELYGKNRGDPNQHASLRKRARRRELEARREIFTLGNVQLRRGRRLRQESVKEVLMMCVQPLVFEQTVGYSGVRYLPCPGYEE
jgi:hypothetical protein